MKKAPAKCVLRLEENERRKENDKRARVPDHYVYVKIAGRCLFEISPACVGKCTLTDTSERVDFLKTDKNEFIAELTFLEPVEENAKTGTENPNHNMDFEKPLRTLHKNMYIILVDRQTDRLRPHFQFLAPSKQTNRQVQTDSSKQTAPNRQLQADSSKQTTLP